MRKKLIYRRPPTFRHLGNYELGVAYVKGWNDAIDYIFPEEKEKREKEAMKKKIEIVWKGSEQDV